MKISTTCVFFVSCLAPNFSSIWLNIQSDDKSKYDLAYGRKWYY